MLTAAQIVSLACMDAKVPGYVTQAGALLNVILDELCTNYDFDLAKSVASVPLTGSFGPYALPADYLRVPLDGTKYTINGVPYDPVPIDYSEFLSLVQQGGIDGYPSLFATDMSQSPPNLWVWPMGNGVTMTLRYQRQMPQIATPETSAVVPWFPNSNYLRTRTAGELMKITDDTRIEMFLGDSPMGAQGILDRYLKMKDDSSNRVKTVTLDRRRFGVGTGLKSTKAVGW